MTDAGRAAPAAVDVVVVGAGPAGLAAARALRTAGVPRVVVAEREQQAGGVPRHTDHIGFGLRDRGRLRRGPAYARANVAAALAAGADVRTGTTAVGWLNDTGLALATADGIVDLRARAVVLATGTRERPRPARLIPGDRPAGIHTTAAVQQLAAAGIRPGRRAVVVGAEHVSFSAVDTLAHAGCATVALVTAAARHQSYAPMAWWSAGRRRVPVLCGVGVAEILGRRRVEAVRLTDGRVLACDTVVLSGDWVPEHALARRGGLTIDAASGAPVVDGDGRTDRPGVFAAGNVLHGALQADWCANEGAHVGRAAARWLHGGRWPTDLDTVPVIVAAPLRWVAPGRLGAGRSDGPAGRPYGGRLVLVAEVFGRRGTAVTASQDGRRLGHGRSRTPVAPGRPFTVAAVWADAVRRGAGPVTLTMETR